MIRQLSAVGTVAVLVAVPPFATDASTPEFLWMLFAPNEPVRATMTHMPVSVAANTLVNVNEDPGLAGAMAHSSELVLSVPVSSTS